MESFLHINVCMAILWMRLVPHILKLKGALAFFQKVILRLHTHVRSCQQAKQTTGIQYQAGVEDLG